MDIPTFIENNIIIITRFHQIDLKTTHDQFARALTISVKPLIKKKLTHFIDTNLSIPLKI